MVRKGSPVRVRQRAPQKPAANGGFRVSVQSVRGTSPRRVESGGVERAEAEAIFEQGREVVVAVLLRMDEQIARLEQRVVRQEERIARLEQQAKRSSRNSS